MISLICGKLFEIEENRATILTESGVGYVVWCTNSLLENFTTSGEGIPDANAIAYIQTIVKEDDISLYGFSSKEERSWFNKFLAIQGVGAKMALLILDTLSFAEIMDGLLSKNHLIFQKVSGIGPKLAKRIANEINTNNLPQTDFVVHPKQTIDNAIFSDAEAALLSLGFSKPDIKKALSSAADGGEFLKVEDLIKYSLGKLTSKKLAE